MSTMALEVCALGKRYRVSGPREAYPTLRNALMRAGASGFRRARALVNGAPRRGAGDEFWALRGVDFEVEAGEIVGIVGGNGAGKSTLLKLLARVTVPTTGSAVVRGRVGSLLEVGTGFHPELTGRENVLLNGAILGMRAAEIRRKFDAIVEFSGVERFIDTPVKRYSSGMYLRLAFAVAAHLQPEILLVDEVLAVGDAAFQKKCLGRMDEVARDGRTVLFVSHNLVAVQALCRRAIWLREGRVAQMGPTPGVVASYLRASGMHEGERVWTEAAAPANEWIRLRRGSVRAADGGPDLSIHSPLLIDIEYDVVRGAPGLAVTVHLHNEAGVLVLSAGPPADGRARQTCNAPGAYRDTCRIPGDLLNDGPHRISLYVMRGNEIVLHEADFLSFTVSDSPRLRGGWMGKWPGAVRPNLPWSTEYVAPLSMTG